MRVKYSDDFLFYLLYDKGAKPETNVRWIDSKHLPVFINAASDLDMVVLFEDPVNGVTLYGPKGQHVSLYDLMTFDDEGQESENLEKFCKVKGYHLDLDAGRLINRKAAHGLLLDMYLADSGPIASQLADYALNGLSFPCDTKTFCEHVYGRCCIDSITPLELLTRAEITERYKWIHVMRYEEETE